MLQRIDAEDAREGDVVVINDTHHPVVQGPATAPFVVVRCLSGACLNVSLDELVALGGVIHREVSLPRGLGAVVKVQDKLYVRVYDASDETFCWRERQGDWTSDLALARQQFQVLSEGVLL